MLTAGLAAILIVGGGGFLLGQRAGEAPAPIAALPAPVAAPPPAATVAPPRSLARADLVTLANAAADAVAGGTALPADLSDAVGKRFVLALPFGCDGPAAADSDAAMRWRYDEKAQALRLHVAPVDWDPADWWEEAPAEVEAIEGFWIERPWTSSETCPAAARPSAARGPQAVILPGQSLAIAQFFGREGARQGRRNGKAYNSVVRLAPESVQADRGFRLRLTGHIAAAPDGGPVICRQPGGAAQRPVCAIAATLDEVAIENPTTGETLATWAVAASRGME